MRKVNSKITTKFLSEPGSVLINHDYFAFAELDEYAIYVCADGLDGEPELMSAQIATEMIIQQFTAAPSLSHIEISGYLHAAHRELQSLSRNIRLKASVVVVVTDYRKYVYATAGNTRMLHIRGSAIERQSEDMSLGQVMLDEGRIPLDRLSQHEERNNLNCFLGMTDAFAPFVSKKFKMQDEDIFVLETRGLWEYVDSGEVLDAATEAKEPQDVLDSVEELMLAKQPKNLDNYTIVVLFVEKIYRNPENRRKRRRLLLILGAVLLVLLIALTVFLVIRHNRIQSRTEEMNNHLALARQQLDVENFARAQSEYEQALELSKSLKKGRETAEIQYYLETLEPIIQGDMALMEGKYEQAVGLYDKALRNGYFADQSGRAYVQGQRAAAFAYMDIFETLRLGDEDMASDHLNLARNRYLSARAKSGQIYYMDGVKTADAKIAEIDRQQKEREDKQEAKDQAAKAEAENAAKEAKAEQEAAAQKAQEDAQQAAKDADKLAGQSFESDADRAMASGEYESAMDLYTNALSAYESAEMANKAAAVIAKMGRLGEKMDKQTAKDKKTTAQDYEEMADEAMASGDYATAQEYYKEAQAAYAEAGDDSTARDMKQKSAESKKEANATATPEPTASPTPSPTPSASPTPSPTPTSTPTDDPYPGYLNTPYPTPWPTHRYYPPGALLYSKQVGDTIESIAAKFGVEPIDLVNANWNINITTAYPETVIVIPTATP